MKKILYILFVAFGTTSALFAQEKTVKYFDKAWKEVGESGAVAYYRTAEKKGSEFIVRDYFASKQLQMMAECKQYDPFLVINGKKTTYYDNGQISEESSFLDNVQKGTSVSYYRNGQLKSEIDHASDKRRYMKYLSEDGKDLLINGNTVVTIPTETGTNFEEIADYVLKGSYSVSNSGDTVFTVVEKGAEYKGGMSALTSDLKRFVVYPRSARKKGIEGTVFISFVVDKLGSVENPEIIKGIWPECDDVALQAVRKLNNWLPAEHHGRRIKSRFVIPVAFRLR